jgi:hypothetical protein
MELIVEFKNILKLFYSIRIYLLFNSFKVIIRVNLSGLQYNLSSINQNRFLKQIHVFFLYLK